MSALKELEQYIKYNDLTLERVVKSKLCRSTLPLSSISTNQASDELDVFLHGLKKKQQIRAAQLKQVTSLFFHELKFDDQSDMNMYTSDDRDRGCVEDDFQSFLLGENCSYTSINHKHFDTADNCSEGQNFQFNFLEEISEKLKLARQNRFQHLRLIAKSIATSELSNFGDNFSVHAESCFNMRSPLKDITSSNTFLNMGNKVVSSQLTKSNVDNIYSENIYYNNNSFPEALNDSMTSLKSTAKYNPAHKLSVKEKQQCKPPKSHFDIKMSSSSKYPLIASPNSEVKSESLSASSCVGIAVMPITAFRQGSDKQQHHNDNNNNAINYPNTSTTISSSGRDRTISVTNKEDNKERTNEQQSLILTLDDDINDWRSSLLTDNNKVADKQQGSVNSTIENNNNTNNNNIILSTLNEELPVEKDDVLSSQSSFKVDNISNIRFDSKGAIVKNVSDSKKNEQKVNSNNGMNRNGIDNNNTYFIRSNSRYFRNNNNNNTSSSSGSSLGDNDSYYSSIDVVDSNDEDDDCSVNDNTSNNNYTTMRRSPMSIEVGGEQSLVLLSPSASSQLFMNRNNINYNATVDGSNDQASVSNSKDCDVLSVIKHDKFQHSNDNDMGSSNMVMTADVVNNKSSSDNKHNNTNNNNYRRVDAIADRMSRYYQHRITSSSLENRRNRDDFNSSNNNKQMDSLAEMCRNSRIKSNYRNSYTATTDDDNNINNNDIIFNFSESYNRQQSNDKKLPPPPPPSNNII